MSSLFRALKTNRYRVVNAPPFSLRKTHLSSNAETSYRIIVSNSTNPFFNIAYEQYLFNSPISEHERVLYLWRNEPSVIIGRFQGAWKECNVKAMESAGVHLVRRASGGGAVYQDLGNSIFTFVAPKHGPEGVADNNSVIVKALKSMGVSASPTGRNDIEVNGFKVSGAAFRHAKGRSLHHGTLLLNLDMGALGNYLTPNKLKMQSKGISSVAARVMNLQTIAPNITHQNLSEALINAFKDFHNLEEVSVQYVDETFAKENSDVNGNMETIMDWNWRFGKEPEFSHHLETRFAWGLIDLYLVVMDGIIKEVTFNTDVLDVDLVTGIQEALMGCEYSPQKISSALLELQAITNLQKSMDPNYDGKPLKEFTEWLVQSL